MNLSNTTNSTNINNLLLNLTNKVLPNNAFQSEGADGQGMFAKMLSTILIGNGQAITSDEYISNEDITNLMNSSCKEDILDNQDEIDYTNIVNMFCSGFMQNSINPQNNEGIELNNMTSENTLNGLNLNIQNSIKSLNFAKENNLVEKSINRDSKEHSIFGDKVNQELPVIKSKVNYLSDSNNNLTQSSIVSRKSLVSSKSNSNIQDNSFDKITSIIEDLNNTDEMKTGISRIRDSEEVLLKSNESKDITKTNIEFSNNILENKTPIIIENNKIIEVSDESNKIKDTVLAQVEDKIIFMANEKEGIQQVTMELNPKDLGKVNIKMSVGPERISVEIMALDQKTSSILMSSAQDLTRALQNHFSNGNVNVTVTENVLNQYSQNDMNYNQQHSQKEHSHNSQNFNNNVNDLDDNNFITEMINLRNFKLNTVV